jgi:hypothetical protein
MVRGRMTKNNGTMKSLSHDPVQPVRRFGTALRLAIGLAGTLFKPAIFQCVTGYVRMAQID